MFKINIAATNCPMLWVQAPITPTKGSENRSFFRTKEVNEKLRIVPERLMKKAEEKKPMLKKLTSKIRATKKEIQSRVLKFNSIKIVVMLAKPSFAPGTGSKGGKELSTILNIRAVASSMLR